MDTAARPMTREAFRAWAEQQPHPRWELVRGEAVAMSPERMAHLRLKSRLWRILDREVARLGLPLEVLPDGATVEVGADTDYVPDLVINEGDRPPPDATVAPRPMLIAEVLSPSTQAADLGAKLSDYFKMPSLRHYLVVAARRRLMLHYRRVDGRVEMQAVEDGALRLEPPGIVISLDELYGE